jgi:electron transport complex protein RnfC
MTAVAMGDTVGSSQAFVSAPVHASISGKTKMPGVTTLPNGRHVKCVQIAAEGEQLEGAKLWDEVYGGDWPREGIESLEPKAVAQAVRDAGVVGMGGAAFPTHVKLTVQEKKPIDTILVNGCECEPYLTADERLMIEAPHPIIAGVLIVMRATKAKRAVICIEDNKPESLAKMREAVQGTGITVQTMKTKYPQGGEKQLAQAVLGRKVPTGGLPLDVGIVVINVGTAAAVARAVLRKKPLTHRVISVTGGGIQNPKNLFVPIGTSYKELIDHCGGLKEDAARIVAGGPMTGFTLASVDTPVTKGTSGVTVLTQKDVEMSERTQCVRCGRCVDVCPMNLVPSKLGVAVEHLDWELARRYHLMACIECGCCAYACPASIPLVQMMRVGKAMLPKE